MEIGNYIIEKVDEDNFSVISKGDKVEHKVIICGGDFETTLSTLFIDAKRFHNYKWEGLGFVESKL